MPILVVNCFYDSASYNWLAEKRKILNGGQSTVAIPFITCLIVDKQQLLAFPAKK